MFLETICIKNGVVQQLEAHISRMKQTAAHFGFAAPALPYLELVLPESLLNTNVKCRIEYKETIRNLEFEAYQPKNIRSLMLLNAEHIDYRFKYSDRTKLNALHSKKENCSEVLIVCNGCITDTTYSNVVFRKGSQLFTPDTYLLNGTKRQKLLRESIIQEARITVDNLMEFDHVYLINSMLDVEDGVGVAVKDVR